MITSCINIFGVTLLAICDALAQTSFVPLIKKRLTLLMQYVHWNLILNIV